jgi:AcrR family transcriptional regulator
LRSEEQVEWILDAVTPLFAEKSYDGVTTRELAAAAGLNIATVHHHLGTKGEVYRWVVAALEDDHLIREAPAIVGCRYSSAREHYRGQNA